MILALPSCQPVHKQLEPTIVYTPQVHQIEPLSSAFPEFNEEEKCQEWTKELILGNAFARELDLYRALTCYKRARILLPEDAIERQLQIDYDIILCYYLGLKYQNAITTFENSLLTNVNPLFPAFNNLILVLYDSYMQVGQEDKAATLLELIQKCSPETAQDLSLYDHLTEGRIAEVEALACEHRYQETIHSSLDFYYQNRKSVSKARTLNAILPGAGYYYVGQQKSAMTSFLINVLFTAAAYQFFHKGYIAAGLITTSLETGWYLGGINGAGIEAEEFNLRLYEGIAKNTLIKCDGFPVLMFETAF